QEGITLLELVVVLSILAVVASIVTPAVAGKTAKSRETVQFADIQAVQSAVDSYASEAPSRSTGSGTVGLATLAQNNRFPVWDETAPTSTDYWAVVTGFVLPNGTTATLYVKPLDFAASYTRVETGTVKRFVPDYLKQMPRYALATVDATGHNDAGAVVFTRGTISFVGGKDSVGATPTRISMWVMDHDGAVRMLFDPDQYAP
ncbi:MAG: prepilin-type N-terminal cleavage/methylation domain-containing protein, partial [Chloroflexota bacterium]